MAQWLKQHLNLCLPCMYLTLVYLGDTLEKQVIELFNDLLKSSVTELKK